MECRDVMKTAVKACRTSTSSAECASIMAEHDVGFVPVIDDNGRLLGVVTDRDLAVRVLGKNRPAHTAIGAVMTSEVVTCGPSDSLRFAEGRLAESKKSRIVVVDDDKKVLGVISLSDIGQLEDPERAGRVLKTITHREATGIIGARE